MRTSDYSEIKPEQFRGLRLRNVMTLVGLLTNLDYRKLDHVRRRYEESATDFDLTVYCLSCLDLVDGADNQTLRLRAEVEWLSCSNPSFHKSFFEFVRKHTKTAEAIDGFFRGFRFLDGEACLVQSRHPTSGDVAIRDFLTDFGIITFFLEEQKFRLQPEFLDLFVDAVTESRFIAPEDLKAKLQRNEVLGELAEIAIIDFETKRVGQKYESDIIHVSKVNAAAGYDIRSVSLLKDSVVPRYIEVKAVSNESFEFYWSSNEVNVASCLGSSYFLYLLPVSPQGGFLISLLRILANPVVSVLGADEWLTTQGTVICRLKHLNTDSL